MKLQVAQAATLIGIFGFIGHFIGPNATYVGWSVKQWESLWLALGANADLQGPIFLDATRWVMYYMFFLWTIGAQVLISTIILKWVLLGKLKDGHKASGVSWDLRTFVVNWGWNISYALFSSYWIDCTIFVISLYNVFGANVSYKCGIRFLQNMLPHHADFVTIKKGANMSNCVCHPSTAENSKVYKDIVLEENTFVGLMSLVQGGVTLGTCSAVATTSHCKQSLTPYSKQLGAMHMKAPPADELPTGNDDFEVSDFMFFMSMLPSIVATMLMRAYVLGGYMLGVSCVVAVCIGSMDYVPMALILAVAVFGICFFLGVLYMWVMQYSLHPRQEIKLGMMSVWAMCWMQYTLHPRQEVKL